MICPYCNTVIPKRQGTSPCYCPCTENALRQTTRCFECGDEQWVGMVERGQDCLQTTPAGRRCAGRYVGLHQHRKELKR